MVVRLAMRKRTGVVIFCVQGKRRCVLVHAFEVRNLWDEQAFFLFFCCSPSSSISPFHRFSLAFLASPRLPFPPSFLRYLPLSFTPNIPTLTIYFSRAPDAVQGLASVRTW
jgi:hypothetical protein